MIRLIPELSKTKNRKQKDIPGVFTLAGINFIDPGCLSLEGIK